MSDKTKGEGYIITTYFLKTTVQCALVNTKGQYILEHHLKGYWKQIRKHDFVWFYGDISEMMIKGSV